MTTVVKSTLELIEGSQSEQRTKEELEIVDNKDTDMKALIAKNEDIKKLHARRDIKDNR